MDLLLGFQRDVNIQIAKTLAICDCLGYGFLPLSSLLTYETDSVLVNQIGKASAEFLLRVPINRIGVDLGLMAASNNEEWYGHR